MQLSSEQLTGAPVDHDNSGDPNACVERLEQHMASHRERRKRCARRRAFRDWHTLALIARAHDHSKHQIENHQIILQRAVHGHTRALLELDQRDDLINDFKDQVLTADRALQAVRRQRTVYFCAAAIFNKLEVLLFERKLTSVLHWRGIAATPPLTSPAWCTLYESAKMIGDCYRQKPMSRLLRRQQVRARLSKVLCKMLARWIKREVCVSFRHLAAPIVGPGVSTTPVSSFMPSSWANLSRPSSSRPPPYRASAATVIVDRAEDETSLLLKHTTPLSEKTAPHSERSTSTEETPARARHTKKPIKTSPEVNASRFGCEFDPRGFGIYTNSDGSSTARSSSLLTEPEQGVARLLFPSGTFATHRRRKMKRDENRAGKTLSTPSCDTVFQPALPDYSKKRGAQRVSCVAGVGGHSMGLRQQAPKLSSRDRVLPVAPQGDTTPCATPTDASSELAPLSTFGHAHGTPPHSESPKSPDCRDSPASPTSKASSAGPCSESRDASSRPPPSPHSMSSRGSRLQPQMSTRSTSPITAQTPSLYSQRSDAGSNTQHKRPKPLASPAFAQTPSQYSQRSDAGSNTQHKRPKPLASPASAQTPSLYSQRSDAGSNTQHKRPTPLVSPASAQTPSLYSQRSDAGSNTQHKRPAPLASPASAQTPSLYSQRSDAGSNTQHKRPKPLASPASAQTPSQYSQRSDTGSNTRQKICQSATSPTSSQIMQAQHKALSGASTNRENALSLEVLANKSSIRVVPADTFSHANPVKTAVTPTPSAHSAHRSNPSPFGRVTSTRESSKQNGREPSLREVSRMSSARVAPGSPERAVQDVVTPSSAQHVADSDSYSLRKNGAGSDNYSLLKDGARCEEYSVCEGDAPSCKSSLTVAPNNLHLASTPQRCLIAALRENRGNFRFRTEHNESRQTVSATSLFAAQMRRNEDDNGRLTTTLSSGAAQVDGSARRPSPFLLSRARMREEEEDRQFFRAHAGSSANGTDDDKATRSSEPEYDDRPDDASSHASPRTVRQRIDANLEDIARMGGTDVWVRAVLKEGNREHGRRSATLPRELDDDQRHTVPPNSMFPQTPHDSHARARDAEDDSPEDSCFIQSPEARSGASYCDSNAGCQTFDNKGDADARTSLWMSGRHEDPGYLRAAKVESDPYGSFDSRGATLQDTVVLSGRPNVRFRNAFLRGSPAASSQSEDAPRSPSMDPLSERLPRVRASYHARSNAVWAEEVADEGKNTQHGYGATVVLGDPDTNAMQVRNVFSAEEDSRVSETAHGAGPLSARSASSDDDSGESVDELFQHRANYNPLNTACSIRGSPRRVKIR